MADFYSPVWSPNFLSPIPRIPSLITYFDAQFCPGGDWRKHSFSFFAVCPKFLQLLGILPNSGHFFEKLNIICCAFLLGARLDRIRRFCTPYSERALGPKSLGKDCICEHQTHRCLKRGESKQRKLSRVHRRILLAVQALNRLTGTREDGR